jgi:hypothetical protein
LSRDAFGTYLERSALVPSFEIGELPMKWILVASVAALSLASVGSADAKGCIKGAIVGGVAGHMAGHGKAGAAAGCVIGHHEANKPDPNNAKAQAPDKK